MRRANRASLLTDLFHGGRQSRQQLGATTALSQASVSNLIGEMIEEGLVEEAGLVGSDGGRPRVLLQVRAGFRYVVGADVGETRILVELYDLAMTRLAVAKFRHEDDPAQVAEQLLAGLSAVIAEAGVEPREVLGFGVGVPGVVDDQGVVYSQTTGWDAIPLGEMLAAHTTVPIFVDNGAKTVGQAEMWFGAGRGARHAVIILIGTGVGAAVVMDGRGYRGANSNAGEWGHTTLVYDGDLCRCGARGCLEAYIGAGRINARLAEALGVAQDAGLHSPFGGDVAQDAGLPSALPRGVAQDAGQPAVFRGEAQPSDLLTRMLAAETQPAAVAEVFEQVVGYLGAGIADLINLFSPERIVIGGGAGLPLAERFLPGIREAAARHALRRPYAQTSIDACRLGPEAVAMGAATLPIARLLAEGGLPAQPEEILPVPRKPPVAATRRGRP